MKEIPTPAGKEVELLDCMREEVQEAMASMGKIPATPSTDPGKMCYPLGMTGFDSAIDNPDD